MYYVHLTKCPNYWMTGGGGGGGCYSYIMMNIDLNWMKVKKYEKRPMAHAHTRILYLNHFI